MDKSNSCGFDSECNFRIQVKVNSYFNKQIEGKKVYVKGRMLEWDVDPDNFSLCDLISEVGILFSWGSCQKPKIWGFDINEGTDVELKSESQIPWLAEMHKEERKLSFWVEICDLDGSSKCNDTTPTYPCTSSQPTTEEIPDQFEGPFEYVGVNDEGELGLEDENENVPNKTNIEPEVDEVHEEITIKNVDDMPTVFYDPQNPKIELHAMFPDADTFRTALTNFAIKNEFEVKTLKSDKKRFIGKCRKDCCSWRIRASRLQDNKTFMIKVLPNEHSCPSTTMVDGKMATKSWVTKSAGEWLRKNPSIGATVIQSRLQEEFHVKVTYHKAWKGRRAALDQIHGKWEDSFEVLYNFKAELEEKCPGSIVEIDCKKVGDKMKFSKMFVALKPCIDGFLNGCRPYLGIDSTHLTGKWNGQLAAACGIDGHNWLYPVAYGVFDKETVPNWAWFVQQLKKAIGSAPWLTLSSDASKGLANAIASVFPNAEHRECMRHLMDNLKKKFHGDIYPKHMWPASQAYTVHKCQTELEEIKKVSPAAIEYLEKVHKQVWCRSQFSEITKCDYVNNNISESFNSWIKDLKELNVVDLLDGIRIRVMGMFAKRRIVGRRLSGVILPNVMKDLYAKSRTVGKHTIDRSSDTCAEVSGMNPDGTVWRYAVMLDTKECACREWQISGLPCVHATKLICNRIRGADLEHYVDDYFSIERFRAAYAGVITPLNDKSQWVKSDPGFKVYPPTMIRPAGRSKKKRIPGALEGITKRQRCKTCGKLGHQARTCKEGEPEDDPSIMTDKRGIFYFLQ